MNIVNFTNNPKISLDFSNLTLLQQQIICKENELVSQSYFEEGVCIEQKLEDKSFSIEIKNPKVKIKIIEEQNIENNSFVFKFNVEQL